MSPSPLAPIALPLCDMPTNTITVDTRLTITHTLAHTRPHAHTYTHAHTGAGAGIMRRSVYNIILLSAMPARRRLRLRLRRRRTTMCVGLWPVGSFRTCLVTCQPSAPSRKANKMAHKGLSREGVGGVKGVASYSGTCHRRLATCDTANATGRHTHTNPHTHCLHTPLAAKLQNLLLLLSSIFCCFLLPFLHFFFLFFFVSFLSFSALPLTHTQPCSCSCMRCASQQGQRLNQSKAN